MTPEPIREAARPKHIELLFQECGINMNNAAVLLQAKDPTPAELTLWTIACLMLEAFREKWGLPEPNTDAPAAGPTEGSPGPAPAPGTS